VRLARRLIVALAVAALAGCGSSGNSASKHAAEKVPAEQATASGARAVALQFTAALYSADYVQACALLTAASQTTVGGGRASNCRRRLSSLATQESANEKRQQIAHAESEIKTVSIRIVGNRAYVGGQPAAVYDDGRWLLTNATI
jgi:hypothetical protein